jgi:cytochrome c553
MKNIIVGILTLGIIALMVMTFMAGGAYHGGEHAKVIENFGDKMNNAKATKIEEKDDRAKEMDKLNALRDKAGNAGAFEVSQAYKSKCASCHGVNGSGEQNGKKLMGPKLFGQSSEKIYQDLVDFKAGRKENMIMKGLLIKLSEEELRVFADEIGEFPARAKEANQ